MISAQSFTGTPSLKWLKVCLLPKRYNGLNKLSFTRSVFSWFLAPPSGQLDFVSILVSHVFLLLQRLKRMELTSGDILHGL